eukprot:40210_1
MSADDTTEETTTNTKETETTNDNDDDKKQETATNNKKEEENDDDDLPKDPTQTTAVQQRRLMKKVGVKVQVVGEHWYPISKKWYDSWEEYTMFKRGDEDIPGGIDNLENSGGERPDRIDNSDLQDKNDENALKGDIQENRTHVWVHADVWTLLFKWYGGGPSFKRKVYERGGQYAKEQYICMHPQLVKLVYCDETTGEIDCSKFEVKGFPPDYTLKSMAKEIEDEHYEKKDDDDENTPLVHIWLKFGEVKAIYPIDKKVKVTDDDLKKEDFERW